tara:strand:- start:90 stop:383 length:294 start_codon:yes stop_codon:yes gene_type:complete
MDSDLTGIRKYLQRTYGLADLQKLADELFLIAESEVIITSSGFEGGNASGQIRSYSKAGILNVVEDLISQLAPPAVPNKVRNAGTIYGDYSTFPTRL